MKSEHYKPTGAKSDSEVGTCDAQAEISTFNCSPSTLDVYPSHHNFDRTESTYGVPMLTAAA